MHARIRSLRSFGFVAGSYGLSRNHALNDDQIESNVPSLIQQADDAVQENYMKIKTPPQYDQLKQIIGNNGTQTFDGFRCIVQKQINLNTTVSHFYWLGSQNVPALYKYYLILHEEDKMISVNTDMDLNMDGEIKCPLAPSLNAKFNFMLSDQAKTGSVHVDYAGDNYAIQMEASRAPGTTLAVGYTQAVTPNISMGGSGKWNLPKGLVNSSYGGMFDDGEHVVCAVWDSQMQVMYLRRVNKNRVHLSSQLLVDEAMKAQASMCAEFILKQSKLNFAVDSDLMIKSSMETSVMAGMNLQVAAEMQHLNSHYRFGYGMMIGGA